jgi:putative nucleotidyltransferase with HDIG domain
MTVTQQLEPRAPHSIPRRADVLGLLLSLAFWALTSTVLILRVVPSNKVALNVGDISTEDIQAPQDVTYQSNILTTQAQDAAAAKIPDIYDGPDPAVARQQETRARQVIDYITTVREDAYASQAERVGWLTAIPEPTLTPEIAGLILELDSEDWQAAANELLRVLESSAQNEIREGQLSAIRRRLPNLIRYSLSDEQRSIVEAMASGLIKPNTFFNAAQTEEARQQAREEQAPVAVTYRAGEVILRGGERVTEQHLEALDALQLRQQDVRPQEIVSPVLLVFLLTLVLWLYLRRVRPEFYTQSRNMILLYVLCSLLVITARMMITLAPDSLLHLLYPLAGLSMLLAVIFSPPLAMIASLVLALVVVVLSQGSLEVTFYALLGSLIGALSLGRFDRLRVFLRASAAVALTNALVVVIFGLLEPAPDAVRLSTRALVGLVGGGLSASLALAAFFVLSSLLDLTTPFHLMELARPTHPLQRLLLLEAPGTYHHSLLVGNLAEQACDAIGANGLLARVGAFYHDVGKTARPYFFTENQLDGVNQHQKLDPQTSAQIIIGHVPDGIKLARKYHLPRVISAFIPEHQGDGLVKSFYYQALQEAEDTGGEVSEEAFHYPGPKPQSRETAIVMLADSCEATVRSRRPRNAQELNDLVHQIISDKLASGQLDECDLTMRDLDRSRRVFVNTLQGVFHPRVRYPEPARAATLSAQERGNAATDDGSPQEARQDEPVPIPSPSG